MKSFTAHWDGRTLIPDEPVKLRRGARCRVTPESLDVDDKGFPLLGLAVKLSKKMRGKYPVDLARDHDHYLHGRPKRT